MTRPLPPRDGHLPEGFYYIDEWIGDCLLDAKYAGLDNFMGRPAAGYERALVVVSRPVRDGLIRAAELARARRADPGGGAGTCAGALPADL